MIICDECRHYHRNYGIPLCDAFQGEPNIDPATGEDIGGRYRFCAEINNGNCVRFKKRAKEQSR